MKSLIKLFFLSIMSAAMLLCNSLSAVAEVTLPEGTVAGLPEKLTAMDDSGNSVSENGEYFFYVENMVPHTEYSKDIEIMNLREDKAYHIYFYAEPVGWSGDFNLDDECTVVFTLDGEQVFEGSVSGESLDGQTNLSDEPIDLGLYEPGDAAKLNATVVWDGTSADSLVDNGERLITADGEQIIRDGSGDSYIEGKVRFRWMFCATVDEEYTPPNTGIFSSSSIGYLIAIAILIVLILIVLIAIVVKKSRERKSKNIQGGQLDGTG